MAWEKKTWWEKELWFNKYTSAGSVRVEIDIIKSQGIRRPVYRWTVRAGKIGSLFNHRQRTGFNYSLQTAKSAASAEAAKLVKKIRETEKKRSKSRYMKWRLK